MLNIRFSNFIKRTVSSFTTLFGQPTKMPLLINKNYLFVQSVNFANYERFKILLAKFKVREGPIDDLSKYFGVNSLPCVTCLKGEFTARFKGDESNLDQLLEILLAIGEEEKKSAVGNE
uniref:Thioredoxin domain-containing protein n=1 Tax=Meloidogyne hapla TaxID=6305 RepID=A0A1I8BQC4_MELHA